MDIVYVVEVRGDVHKTDQEAFTQALHHPLDPEYWARDHWKGMKGKFPEILVDSRVTITGLADFVKKGEK